MYILPHTPSLHMPHAESSRHYLSVYFTVLCSTEAEATAGVRKPEDPLSGTFRSGLSATGEPATLPDNANDA